MSQPNRFCPRKRIGCPALLLRTYPLGLAIIVVASLLISFIGCSQPTSTNISSALPERLVLIVSPQSVSTGTVVSLGQVDSTYDEVGSLAQSLLSALQNTPGLQVDVQNGGVAIGVVGTSSFQASLLNEAQVLNVASALWGLITDAQGAVSSANDFAEWGLWSDAEVAQLTIAKGIADKSNPIPSYMDISKFEFNSFLGCIADEQQQTMMNTTQYSTIYPLVGTNLSNNAVPYTPQYIAKQGQYFEIIIGGLTINPGTTINLSNVLLSTRIGVANQGLGLQPGNYMFTENPTLSPGAAVVNGFIVDANNNKVNITVNCQPSTIPTRTGNVQMPTQTPFATNSKAGTSLVVADQYVTYSFSDQGMTLTATVTALNSSVNGGTVTFTVKDNSGNTIGVPATGTVTNGGASAVYSLPGGTAASIYRIEGSYSGNNLGIINGTASLKVNKATAAMELNSPNTAYSDSGQNILLTATLTVAGSTVNEGMVTFTVKDSHGNIVGLPVWSMVTAGATSATYSLPGGSPASDYRIEGNYSADNLVASLGVSDLMLKQAATTTIVTNTAITTDNLHQATLTATVTAVGATVNQGTVTFHIYHNDWDGTWNLGAPTQAPVVNGVATVLYTLPSGSWPSNVVAEYSGGDNFQPSRTDKGFGAHPVS